YLRSRLIKSNIPVNPRSQKRRRRGRPTRFEPWSYQKRTTIERLFAWLKWGSENWTADMKDWIQYLKGY
ncbi:MAG: hypothetical protein ACLFMM_09775, partial [Methanohalobium sp.]